LASVIRLSVVIDAPLYSGDTVRMFVRFG
jgi:hypothetical protein